MVMYVIYDNPNNGYRKNEAIWIGQSQILQTLQNTKTVENIVEVQADGNELEFILDKFADLPYIHGNGRNQKHFWFGDHAKFIVANLKWQ